MSPLGNCLRSAFAVTNPDGQVGRLANAYTYVSPGSARKQP
jgi:hypothetical protein